MSSPNMACYSVFKRHSNSATHKGAVYKSLGKQPIGLCPSGGEFERLIDTVCAGKLGPVGRKERQMLWCVQEAIKTQDQMFLARAEAIFLFRDEAKSRLLLRFQAVDKDLTIKRGVLGQERDFGTGARKLLQATSNIMARACTRFHGAPSPSRASSFLKKSLLSHLRISALGIAVDSATDETLCAEMMRTATLAGAQAALTPNLKHVIREKAHGTRRLLSRPWSVDALIKDVIMMFCRSRGSVARLIHNSREIRRVVC